MFSVLENLVVLNGTSRYLKGSSPLEKPVMLRIIFFNYADDLFKLHVFGIPLDEYISDYL